MRLVNHYKMGKLIYEALREYGLRLDKSLFVFGNLAPDIFFSFIYRPHFWKNAHKYFDKLIYKLYKKGNDMGKLEVSFCLGKVTHYVCDFFCYAHTSAFPGSLSSHALYEKMQFVNKEERFTFKGDDVCDIGFSQFIAELDKRISEHELLLSINERLSQADISTAMQAASWSASVIYAYIHKECADKLHAEQLTDIAPVDLHSEYV